MLISLLWENQNALMFSSSTYIRKKCKINCTDSNPWMTHIPARLNMVWVCLRISPFIMPYLKNSQFSHICQEKWDIWLRTTLTITYTLVSTKYMLNYFMRFLPLKMTKKLIPSHNYHIHQYGQKLCFKMSNDLIWHDHIMNALIIYC